MTMDVILDRRRHAYRPDLADENLRGHVVAERYTVGAPARISRPVVSVHRAPSEDEMQISQALFGEEVLVFETANGWAWIQLLADQYVGYVRASALAYEVAPATHRVAAHGTYIYPKADLKSVPAIALPLNARLSVIDASGDYFALATGGYVYAPHAAPLGEMAYDFVSVAERFLHTPYLWGGKSPAGIDCSGLVQVALQACGFAAPRDSDMQEAELGVPLRINDLNGPLDGLQRGDLVFWKGHVGIMCNETDLLHANGYHMMTVIEPLHVAAERIALKESPITVIKRLQ